MGGNLFANSTERIDLDTYDLCVGQLNKMFTKMDMQLTLPGLEGSLLWSFPKFYTTKDSFGDVDVVVYPGIIGRGKMMQWLNERYGHVHVNGDVASVVHRHTSTFAGVQVDFIFTDSIEHFKTASEYYSWNDFHGLVGKLFKHFRLSLGDRGLLYEVRIGHTAKDVIVSTDFRDIYKLIDVEVHNFATRQEMFEAVYNSIYFSTAHMCLEQLTHRDRVRNRKRGTWKEFEEFVKSKPAKNAADERSLIRLFEAADEEKVTLLANPFLDIMEVEYQNAMKDMLREHISFHKFIELLVDTYTFTEETATEYARKNYKQFMDEMLESESIEMLVANPELITMYFRYLMEYENLNK